MKEESKQTDLHPRPERRSRMKKLPVLLSLLLGLILCYVLVLMPLPFYILKPGTSEPIKPMVAVKNPQGEEKGNFMLTTVWVAQPNLVNYLYALVNPFQEIRPKSSLYEKGETEQEYNERQDYFMMESQSSAIRTAYQKAGIPYKVVSEGVMVLKAEAGTPAAQVLAPGDYILKVNDTPIKERKDLDSIISVQKPGDTIQVTYKRGKEEKTASVELVSSKSLQPAGTGANDAERTILGIQPAIVQKISAEDPQKQVEIKAGEIGGPSAGLMFTLEILNQLQPGDLTKGYRIAGTGTIDDKGNVGPIGGIQHKIIAADKQRAEIFFAPQDITIPGSGTVNNYSDAVQRAKQIHSSMKVVPVGTIDDALKYLEALPAK